MSALSLTGLFCFRTRRCSQVDMLLRSHFFLPLNPSRNLQLYFLHPEAHVEFDQVVQPIELLAGVVEVESRVRSVRPVVD